MASPGGLVQASDCGGILSSTELASRLRKKALTMPHAVRVATVWLPAFAGWLCLTALVDGKAILGLPYPPGLDQDAYLAAGQQFTEHGVFMWRAPVYSAWVGIHYLLCGRSLEWAFYVEKFATVALLAAATAALARRVFNRRAAFLIGLWTINCKYLVTETNGSHALAAFLIVVSMLCLSSAEKKARVPAALFFLFLSSQARSDMWLPLTIVTSFLVYKGVRPYSTTDRVTAVIRAGGRGYVVSIALAVTLSLLFHLRSGPPEAGRLTFSFQQNFAVAYVERNGLGREYPDAWRDYRTVWARAIPDTNSPMAAVYNHPGEMLRHVLYNCRLLLIALPAMVFGFVHPWLMLCAFLLFLAAHVPALGHEHFSVKSWADLTDSSKRLLALWALAVFTIALLPLVLRVAARFYIQLIPLMQMVLLLALFSSVKLFTKTPGAVRRNSGSQR